jgi:hypothetical protein
LDTRSGNAAMDLLHVTLRREGIHLDARDIDRLAGEFARFLAEGQAILEAVPSENEPQTVAAFGGETDAS